jgi:rubredoxin
MSYEHERMSRVSALPLLRFRCDGCGYGASSRHEPERCPMCGGAAWSEEGWTPFASLASDLFPVSLRAEMVVGADANAPLARETGERSGVPGAPLS